MDDLSSLDLNSLAVIKEQMYADVVEIYETECVATPLRTLSQRYSKRLMRHRLRVIDAVKQDDRYVVWKNKKGSRLVMFKSALESMDSVYMINWWKGQQVTPF